MKKFAVIGNPINHSLSPKIHDQFSKQTGIKLSYKTRSAGLTREEFNQSVHDFFADKDAAGLNVTVPFKEFAFDLCNGQLTDRAKAAGAVNTLLIKNEKLYGDNTDGVGLVYDLKKRGWLKDCKKVLILGAGGATRGVILPLLDNGVIQIEVANRTKNKADVMVASLAVTLVGLGLFGKLNPLSTSAAVLGSALYADNTPSADDLILMRDGQEYRIKTRNLTGLSGYFDLVINATSASLSGAPLVLPPDLTFKYAYEMAYGKESTFLKQAENRGEDTADGKGMLIGQAAEAFKVWHGKMPDPSKVTLD